MEQEQDIPYNENNNDGNEQINVTIRQHEEYDQNIIINKEDDNEDDIIIIINEH